MTKWDKILFVSVLLVSITGIFFVSALGTSDNEKYVIVSVDGVEAKKISVTGNEKNKIYDFSFDKNEGYIEINEGSVRMLEMSDELCPEGICSNTGWISKKYQTIVCLPNKITVSFDYTGEEELDIISY